MMNGCFLSEPKAINKMNISVTLINQNLIYNMDIISFIFFIDHHHLLKLLHKSTIWGSKSPFVIKGLKRKSVNREIWWGGWAIAITVQLLPSPSSLKTLLEISVLSRPVKFFPDLARVAINLSVVTWASRQVLDLDLDASCFLACLNKLLHRATYSNTRHLKAQSPNLNAILL